MRHLRYVSGIHGSTLAFFRWYLSERKLIVSVQGRELDPSPWLYGVPRGSDLGPALFTLYKQPVSDIIERHSSYTDGTELYNVTPFQHWFFFSAKCKNVGDVKKWTIHNKLKPNEDKTEALLFDPSKSSDLPDVPGIGQSYVPFVSILPVI